MSGFSADWLALREPFDRTAREATWSALALPLHAARWRAQRGPQAGLNITDLACGSGANLRALAPRIGGKQTWRLVDHDPELLGAMPTAMRRWAQQEGHRISVPPSGNLALQVDGQGFSVDVLTEQRDLARDIDAVDFSQTHLVTASALLDLVSADWLDALAVKARTARAAMLFALSVDGRTTWEPAHALDAPMHRLFMDHQRRDKGFGPALGTDAVQHACRTLAAQGFTLVQARSDWRIDGASSPGMQTAMIQGMATAAIEQETKAAAMAKQWKTHRLAALPTTCLTVGHIDLLALPATPAPSFNVT